MKLSTACKTKIKFAKFLNNEGVENLKNNFDLANDDE